MKILSLITHPHAIPNPSDLRSSSEHKLRYFWLNQRALWPSHRQQHNCNVPRSRNVVRTSVKQSMWHQWLNLREHFLCSKKTKITTLFNNSSPLSYRLPPFGEYQKYLNLCCDDERRPDGFGTTWGWVINDRIFILGWTNPLSLYKTGMWTSSQVKVHIFCD